MDMEGYFTIYLVFFWDITGYPRFLMCILVEAPIVCAYGGFPIHGGYHGVPVNHPVEIGIFHPRLSSYWGTKFGTSPYELRDSPAWQETSQHVKQSSELSKVGLVINHGICGYPYQTKPLSKTRCGFSDPDGGIPTCLMMCQAFARTAVRLRLNGMARARPSLNTALHDKSRKKHSWRMISLYFP